MFRIIVSLGVAAALFSLLLIQVVRDSTLPEPDEIQITYTNLRVFNFEGKIFICADIYSVNLGISLEKESWHIDVVEAKDGSYILSVDYDYSTPNGEYGSRSICWGENFIPNKVYIAFIYLLDGRIFIGQYKIRISEEKGVSP